MMKKNILHNYIWMLVAGLLWITACRKTDDIIPPEDAQVGFYNVSEYVYQQIKNSYRYNYVFIDNDTLPSRQTPAFTTMDYQFQYPNRPFYATQSQPWITYLRVTPGYHRLALTDTSARFTLITDTLNTQPGHPVTVYFADNLGKFRTWKINDDVNTSSDSVYLRLLHFSPDAGDIYYTINGERPKTSPTSFVYGTIPGFTARPCKGLDTLRLRFYRTAEPNDAFFSARLMTTPGGAYNLVVKGYQNNQSFKDPASKQSVNISAGLNVMLTQIK